MGLIKDLAGDKPLQRQVVTHWECIKWKQRRRGSGEGKEGVNYDKEKILIAFCTYQSLEVIWQLSNNLIESIELAKHVGNVFTGEAADGLQIWMSEGGVHWIISTFKCTRFDLLQKTGVTFGFVTSVIGPNGRAWAIDWDIQGHDISYSSFRREEGRSLSLIVCTLYWCFIYAVLRLTSSLASFISQYSIQSCTKDKAHILEYSLK